jgi:RHH-type rel operon transcriptional repressor/antitoxin RelB
MLSVKLPIDLENRLGELSKATGRTKTYYVREAIESHIEDMEDRYLAFKRLENPMPALSMEEMRDELKKMDR